MLNGQNQFFLLMVPAVHQPIQVLWLTKNRRNSCSFTFQSSHHVSFSETTPAGHDGRLPHGFWMKTGTAKVLRSSSSACEHQGVWRLPVLHEILWVLVRWYLVSHAAIWIPVCKNKGKGRRQRWLVSVQPLAYGHVLWGTIERTRKK